MQQIIKMTGAQQALWFIGQNALPGDDFKNALKEVIWEAPIPRTDEAEVYRVSQSDVPVPLWPVFRMLEAKGYAEKPRYIEDEPDQGEVLQVDASILELLLEAIRQILAALLVRGPSAGMPAPTKPVGSRSGAGTNGQVGPGRRRFLIEHDGLGR